MHGFSWLFSLDFQTPVKTPVKITKSLNTHKYSQLKQ